MANYRYFISCLFLFMVSAYGQINPVQNLTYSQTYDMGNYYNLRWEEPAQPHDQLVGYNIYRNDNFYRFQTDTYIQCLKNVYFPPANNCAYDFLIISNVNPPIISGFSLYVTAIYNASLNESSYNQTIQTNPSVLSTANFANDTVNIFPNPTTGIVNLENNDFEKIQIFDKIGRNILSFQPNEVIDLAQLVSDTYFMKLINSRTTIIQKIILKKG